MYKNTNDWYIWPGERSTPKYFFSFFFLRREGEKECLIHFFTSHQPPSALNRSTSGWPVEARKMAATKYVFAQLGEVKTMAIIVSWRTSTRLFFCDEEISAGVPTHIITCNCNNWLVYKQILLHPSFLQVNRYYGISQHFVDNWVMIYLQSYLIIPSSLLPETDNKSMTSKLWPKQWSQLSKKIWAVVAYKIVFETASIWMRKKQLFTKLVFS